jgi:hypothetical protein
VLRKGAITQEHIDWLAEEVSWAIHNLLNRMVSTPAELDAMKDEFKKWQQKVENYMEGKFTKSDVLHFSRLGVIPGNQYEIATVPGHNHQLSMVSLKI